LLCAALQELPRLEAHSGTLSGTESRMRRIISASRRLPGA
jgi:hypothetical protein